MLTLEQVRGKTGEMGVNITPRTFWRYVELGLIAQGEKHPGMGNVFYFADDTPARIVQIQTLKNDLGIPLRLIRKSLLFVLEDRPWDKSLVRKVPSGVDLIVWWAGLITRLGLVHKPKIQEADFHALLEKLKPLFDSFLVRDEAETHL
jgi:hypothetical protein